MKYNTHMIELRTLPLEAVDRCIENGEFDEDITGAAKRVAVVMTQGWCPQWTAMKHYLERIAREAGHNSGQNPIRKSGDAPEGDSDDGATPLVVYTLVYDQIAAFHSFRTTKENVFQNDLVPYVRYYKDGALRDTSNFVGREEFLHRAKK